MATIKDVAREAGVSTGTVSAVLNGHKTIRDDNIRRVNAAIDKLGYKPNLIARTLKTGASGSIGLLIPDITNPFYPELARGVEDSARHAGMNVFLCSSDRSTDKEREYLNALLAKNVDGIIIAKTGLACPELQKITARCRLVLVDPAKELERSFDSVSVNDRDGVTKAMHLLFGFGHTRIAYISGLFESASAFNRYAAYKDALRERGVPFREDYVRKMRYDWFSGYTAALELLKLLDPPTAIVAANDLIALGALKALREREIRVPLDMSVVGFDDIDPASYCSPPLTTVRQPKYEMGVASVNIMLRRSGALSTDGGVMVKSFDTELISRGTVDYARTAIKDEFILR